MAEFLKFDDETAKESVRIGGATPAAANPPQPAPAASTLHVFTGRANTAAITGVAGGGGTGVLGVSAGKGSVGVYGRGENTALAGLFEGDFRVKGRSVFSGRVRMDTSSIEFGPVEVDENGQIFATEAKGLTIVGHGLKEGSSDRRIWFVAPGGSTFEGGIRVDGNIKIEGGHTIELGAGTTKQVHNGMIGYRVFGDKKSLNIVGAGEDPNRRDRRITLHGDVDIDGKLTKNSGTFRIDHPLDPANKYLSHSFIESPDMMNIYNGNVTTDGNGDAIVDLPAYFEALNMDFRYQLTVIGTFSQAIIAKKIRDSQFEIKTDRPNVEVSWQVTGIRQDPWARDNRIVVEEEKPEGVKGRYLYPEGYGQPIESGEGWMAPEVEPHRNGRGGG